jgi:hypothetical protein
MSTKHPTPAGFECSDEHPPVLPAIFYAGVGLYVLSFFLPAVQLGDVPFRGLVCAWYALTFWRLPQAYYSQLAIFGGLINPLAALFIALRLLRHAPRVRAFLSVAIVVFIPLTWTAISRMSMGIRIGHIAWIAGLVLLLFPGSQIWPSLSDLRWPAVAAIILLGWLGYSKFSEQPIQPATERDLFLFDVGVTYTSWDACQRIHPYAEGHGDDGPGYEIRYLQSECYYFVAQAMHVESFCEHVRAVSVGMKDGSKFTSRFCKKQLTTPRGQGPQISGARSSLQLVDQPTDSLSRLQGSAPVWTADPGGDESLREMMQAVGIGDGKVNDFLFARNPYSNSTVRMYQQLRKDVSFLNRLKAGTTYDEPLDLNKLRPANSLEYLYQLVALDNDEPELCGKLSPNATFQPPHEEPALLRSRCYLSITMNRRAPVFCSQLPSAESGFPLTPKYDSREGCISVAESYRRADFRGGMLGYHGAPFPDQALLPEALGQLGYDLASLPVTLEKPTAAEYRAYYMHLALAYGSADRAEFLRRVEQLAPAAAT